MTSTPDNASNSFNRSYAGDTATLAQLRADVRVFLSSGKVDLDLSDRIVLALTELATNAIEASPASPYTVEVNLSATSIDASVTNVPPVAGHSAASIQEPRQTDVLQSRIPPRTDWGPTEALMPRGRGLLLVEALADSLEIHNGDSSITASVSLLR